MRYTLFLLLLITWGCDRERIGPQEMGSPNEAPGLLPPGSVLILNEGNFMRGNASLSSYQPDSQKVAHQLYQQANDQLPLGDVAQDLRQIGAHFFLSLNNSGLVLKLQKASLKEEARSRSLGTPLYMAQRGDSLLVTDLYKAQIHVLSLSSLESRGKIKLPFSARHLAWWQGRLALGCERGLMLLNASTTAFDTLLPTPVPLRQMKRGLQQDLWVLGQYTGQDSLLRWQDIHQKPKTYALPSAEDAQFLKRVGDSLYGMTGKTVWRLSLREPTQGPQPWISTSAQTPYALGVDPYRGECYVADALNFDQRARIFRYGPQEALQDSFRAGPISNLFHFTAP